MAYIVNRKDRFYVVAYDGVDPLTGRGRRRWHPAGDDRQDAELLARRLEHDPRQDCRSRITSTRLGPFLTDTWLPRKRMHVRATTAYRYGWMIDNYLVPHLGEVVLDTLRPHHLDHLYQQLLTGGEASGRPLAPKTVHETHLILRNALDLALASGAQRRNDRGPRLARHRAGGLPGPRIGPAAVSGVASRRAHGDATRRDRRAAVERTSTSMLSACRSAARSRASPGARPSSVPRPRPADAASTSTG